MRGIYRKSHPAESQISVLVEAFEYGCCRTPPAVGDTISGRLTAHPYAAPIGHELGTRWDRDRDLVRMGDVSAHWDPTYGDPIGRPIAVWLSWHDDGSQTGVEVTGVVVAVDQLYQDPTLGPENRIHEQIRSVSAVEKFPENTVLGDGTVLTPAGAQVVLTALEVIEPTPADAAEARARADRRRRTFTVRGPAASFGEVVPSEGEPIRIDFDDGSLDINGFIGEPDVAVSGTVAFVGQLVPQEFYSAVVAAPEGGPASEVVGDLVVEVVAD